MFKRQMIATILCFTAWQTAHAQAPRAVSFATGLGPIDSSSNGIVAARTLTLIKDRPGTVLRIGYNDAFRVLGVNASCRWELLVDGQRCPSGALIFDFHDNTYSGGDVHRSQALFAYCGGLRRGLHTITVAVSNYLGDGTSLGSCYTGYSNARWTIEAEEVSLGNGTASRE